MPKYLLLLKLSSNSQLSIKSQELLDQKIDTQSLENEELKVLQPTNQAKIIVLNKITAKSKEFTINKNFKSKAGNKIKEIYTAFKEKNSFDFLVKLGVYIK